MPQVTCNHKGGIKLHHGLSLQYGPNEVSKELWEQNKKTLNPAWLAGLLAQKVLVVSGEQEPGLPMGAVEKVEAVNKCTSLAELEKLLVGENRKRVLAAAEKKLDSLMPDETEE